MKRMVLALVALMMGGLVTVATPATAHATDAVAPRSGETGTWTTQRCRERDRRTVCVRRVVDQQWSGDQGYEYGTGPDDSLASQYCVQDWPEAELVEYEAFAMDYLVREVRTVRTVRTTEGHRLVARSVRSRTVIVDLRTTGGGSVTCTYA